MQTKTEKIKNQGPSGAFSEGQAWRILNRHIKSKLNIQDLSTENFMAGISWGLLTFLLSRLSVFNGLMPFGIVIFFCLSFKKVNGLILALGVLLGAIISSDIFIFYQNAATIAIFILLKKVTENSEKRKDISIAIIGTSAVILPQMLYIVFRGFLLYDLIRSLILMALVFILVLVFNKGLFNHLVITEKSNDLKSEMWRIKELAASRMNAFSQSLFQLSKAFGNMNEDDVPHQDIYVILDRATQKICFNCEMNPICWGKNFYGTYRNLFQFISNIEKKRGDIPAFFQNECTKTTEFIKEIKSAYELYKIDTFWQKKITENRKLLAQQINWISDMIQDIPSEMNMDIHFEYDLEKEIRKVLRKYKIENLMAYKDPRDRLKVVVECLGCDGLKKCEKDMASLLTDAVGHKMVKLEKGCICDKRTGVCRLLYKEENNLGLLTGVARRCKNEQSCTGDHYTFFETPDSKYILTLCDGMGSGRSAADQSKNAVEIIEQLLKTDFKHQILFKLINSVLKARNRNDYFTTVDIAMVDLYSGSSDFFKIGAAPTFIKRNKEVEVIKSVTLPAGILDNVEFEFKESQLMPGDFIIMMSDGVYEIFDNEGINPNDIISGIQTKNPQDLADFIFKEAVKMAGTEIKDDMTLLVSKVWKR